MFYSVSRLEELKMSSMSKLTGVVFLLGLNVGIVASTARAHKPTVTKYTYNQDIYPIFQSKCGSCHRSGGVGPMSLLSYESAFPWAVSIKNQVLSLEMPPWSADERYGVFLHEGGLTAREVDTVVDWSLGGSPEGDSLTIDFQENKAEWLLGKPQHILPLPDVVALSANETEALKEFIIPTNFSTSVAVRAIDFNPGARNIVRSAVVRVKGHSEPIATWISGQVTVMLPEGYGYVLPADSKMVLSIHYKKTWLDEGVAVSDRSALGVYLDQGRNTKVIDIVKVKPTEPHVLSSDSKLVALLPQIDAEVNFLAAYLVKPDGARQTILALRDPNRDWPRKYWLSAPLYLPSKSSIEILVESGDLTESSILLDLAPTR